MGLAAGRPGVLAATAALLGRAAVPFTQGSNADLPIFPRPRADYPETLSGRGSRVFKRTSAPRRDGASEQVRVCASRTVLGQPATLIGNRSTPPRVVFKTKAGMCRKTKG